MKRKCQICNSDFYIEDIRDKKGRFTGGSSCRQKYCSDECCKKAETIWQKKGREKRWFGGKREEILKRDNYKCRFCGSTERLMVHHEDGKGRKQHPREVTYIINNNVNNLITLCSSCHSKLHSTLYSNDEKKIEEVSKMMRLGFSNRKIGRELGMSHPTVAVIKKIIDKIS